MPEVTVNYEENDTIADLKKRLEEATSVAPEKQNLIRGAVKVEDDT